MPLLFALGIHEAIESVAGRLQEGEEIAAFLDDIYVLCQPDRVSAVHSILADSLQRNAGVGLNQGKTRVWTAPA